VLQSGGNNWWQALWTKAEPHAMRLQNGEIVIVRLSDGAVVARIRKPAGYVYCVCAITC
jgi:hypothetical protein